MLSPEREKAHTFCGCSVDILQTQSNNLESAHPSFCIVSPAQVRHCRQDNLFALCSFFRIAHTSLQQKGINEHLCSAVRREALSLSVLPVLRVLATAVSIKLMASAACHISSCAVPV